MTSIPVVTNVNCLHNPFLCSGSRRAQIRNTRREPKTASPIPGFFARRFYIRAPSRRSASARSPTMLACDAVRMKNGSRLAVPPSPLRKSKRSLVPSTKRSGRSLVHGPSRLETKVPSARRIIRNPPRQPPEDSLIAWSHLAVAGALQYAVPSPWISHRTPMTNQIKQGLRQKWLSSMPGWGKQYRAQVKRGQHFLLRYRFVS